LRRRLRKRRVIMRVAVGVLTLILAGWIGSILYAVCYGSNRLRVYVQVSGGVLDFYHYSKWNPTNSGIHIIETRQIRLGLVWPSYFTTVGKNLWGIRRVSFPLWPLFCVGFVGTALLWRWDQRPPPGHCQSCGYNLTGNTSGVCPECGKKI